MSTSRPKDNAVIDKMKNAPNWQGIRTLYSKEVRRFLKVYNQTIVAPIINSLLLLAIFSLALGNHPMTIGGLSFAEFMAPGLIMMSLIQHAFANTSSAFIMGKVLGTIIDYLMPPLSAGEVVFSMVMGGVTRGLVVGFTVAISIALFVPMQIHDFGLMIFYAVATSMLLAILGLLAGIFADSFDQMSAVTSYVITPLSFLSGTFYSVNQLPGIWYTISHMNPFFFAIDGFRYSLTGYHDGNIETGIYTLIGCIVVLWIITYVLMARGYRIKT